MSRTETSGGTNGLPGGGSGLGTPLLIGQEALGRRPSLQRSTNTAPHSRPCSTPGVLRLSGLTLQALGACNTVSSKRAQRTLARCIVLSVTMSVAAPGWSCAGLELQLVGIHESLPTSCRCSRCSRLVTSALPRQHAGSSKCTGQEQAGAPAHPGLALLARRAVVQGPSPWSRRRAPAAKAPAGQAAERRRCPRQAQQVLLGCT